jgi:polyhydroxyalkanoate synthesis regulator phasin
MPQGPDWKQLIETGMSFTELRRSQARQIVSELVAQGQLAQDKAAAAVDELLEFSRRRREDVREMVATEIQRQVRALGIATRDDLAKLERKLGASTTPAKKTPAKKAPAVKKAPAKKAPAAKKTPATKAAGAAARA